ncbi:hypothetical protein D3C74_182840 [compost metagenome]
MGCSMDKDKIRELFEQLLEGFQEAEGMVIHDRGELKDFEQLEKKVAEYRKELNKLLE